LQAGLKMKQPNIGCCKNCQKEFKSTDSRTKFCSQSCATRLNNLNRTVAYKTKEVNCNKCGKSSILHANATSICTYCSIFVLKCKDCEVGFLSTRYGPNTKIRFRVGYCPPCFDKRRSEWSRIGGKKRNDNVRSLNEIEFSRLCKEKFSSVLDNPRMFNGWDADIVIEDIKVAVLWNGAWHYKKIKNNCSLNMIQNRDKIKLKEIEKAGYWPYVIRDDGRYNAKFVKSKFDEFINGLNQWLQ